MKYLDGRYYLEVKDHSYRSHATKNKIKKEREPPKSLRTQYQVQNEKQYGKKSKNSQK